MDSALTVLPDKGLRPAAIGTIDSLVVGTASAAPSYSIAVSVGLLVASVGGAAPLALVVAVVPMVLVALCFRELNRAEPDCGTSYAWVRRAFGPRTAWLAGWASIAACLLAMGNLAQVAAVYVFELTGADRLADSKVAQAVAGVGFIGVMAWLSYRGIRIAARTQFVLLVFEVAALGWFVVAALRQADGPPSVAVPASGWGAAFLVAVFLYWGWDSSFSMNEESADPRRTPAVAAVAANVVLAVVFVLVAFAAVGYAGTDRLAGIADDDFFAALGTELLGSAGGRILIGAVLASALASAQTTILPTARTMLSMASREALPAVFGRVSARYATPSVATWAFAGASAALYALLVCVSEAVLADSVAATSVLVCLYYVATCAAVPLYFRGHLTGATRLLTRVVVPVSAATVFTAALVLSVLDLSVPSLIAVGVVLAVGLAGMRTPRAKSLAGMRASRARTNAER